MQDELSERKKRILYAIVNAHIAYGEPVGSKLLADNRSLSCSSATIRNEMAELEAMGYLEQPHTSAGRVPSERGYRYYVDSLRERYEMTTGEIEKLNMTMQTKLTELDEILAEASKLASSLTNYTGIALKPRASKKTVSRFEGVYLSEHNFVLVMIFADGTVTSKNIRLALTASQEDIAHLTALLNQHFAGRTAEEMTLSRICEMEKAMGYLSPLVSPVAKIIYGTLTEEDGGEVRIEGVNRLLQYPEYADVDKFRDMLGLFEEDKDRLLDIVNADSGKNNDVSVYIGKENSVEVMQDSAFVYRTIRRNGEVIGAIGIIGPRRMNYAKVIETVNRVASGVDHMINEPPAENDAKKG